MAIKLAGTERDAIMGGLSVTETAGYFSSLYSRSALVVAPTVSAGAHVPSEFGANSENGWWLGFTYYVWIPTYRSGGHVPFLNIHDAAGNLAARITHDPAAETCYAYVYSSSPNTNYASTTFQLSKSALVRYDLHGYTSGGLAKLDVYRNNLLVATASGAGINRGYKSADIYGGFYYNAYNDSRGFVSEVIVADEQTIGMRVKTFPPVGNGSQTLWEGDYDNVNDPDIGLTSIITNIPGAAETFTHGYTMTAGTAIRALVVGAAAASSDADGIHALLGGEEASFVFPLTAGAAPNAAIYEVNPATGNPYTAAEFNALEFGVRNTSEESS